VALWQKSLETPCLGLVNICDRPVHAQRLLKVKGNSATGQNIVFIDVFQCSRVQTAMRLFLCTS